jgi:hypothetical protein
MKVSKLSKFIGALSLVAAASSSWSSVAQANTCGGSFQPWNGTTYSLSCYGFFPEYPLIAKGYAKGESPIGFPKKLSVFHSLGSYTYSYGYDWQAFYIPECAATDSTTTGWVTDQSGCTSAVFIRVHVHHTYPMCNCADG